MTPRGRSPDHRRTPARGGPEAWHSRAQVRAEDGQWDHLARYCSLIVIRDLIQDPPSLWAAAQRKGPPLAGRPLLFEEAARFGLGDRSVVIARISAPH